MTHNVLKKGILGEKIKMGSVIMDIKNCDILQGKLKMSNGDMYKGELFRGNFEGKGIYTFANGDYYEGGFKNGMIHGRGFLSLGSVKTSYEGEFEQNSLKKGGEGKIIFGSKEIFSGVWNEDQLAVKIPEFGTNPTPIFKDDDEIISDIKSLISIEEAIKEGYISSNRSYTEYREYCDHLEIENVLDLRPDLIMTALEEMSLNYLIKDAMISGSKSQRYLLIEILLKKTLGYLVRYEAKIAISLTPFDRLHYRKINRHVYGQTESRMISKFKDVIERVKIDSMEEENIGNLIFDDFIIIILQTGILELKDLSRLIQRVAELYDDIKHLEHKYHKKNFKEFRSKMGVFCKRRHNLAQILLEILIDVHDYRLVKETKVLRRNSSGSMRDIEYQINQNYENIISIVNNLFESYVTNFFGDRNFEEFIETKFFLSEISLKIQNMLFKIHEQKTDIKLEIDMKMKNANEHIFKKLFNQINKENKTKGITFGLSLEEELSKLSLSFLLPDKVSSLWLKYKDLADMLIPNFIIIYISKKDSLASPEIHESVRKLFKEPYSLKQLNSFGSINNFLSWITNQDFKWNSKGTNLILQEGLAYIDTNKFMREMRQDPKCIRKVRIFNAICRVMDSMKCSISDIRVNCSRQEILKEHNLEQVIKLYLKEIMSDKEMIIKIEEIDDYNDLVQELDEKNFNLIKTIMELRYELIVLPKFRMKNFCSFDFDFSRYEFILRIFQNQILKEKKGVHFNIQLKKEMLHAMVIGSLLTLDNLNEEMLRVLFEHGIVFYNLKDRLCGFTGDFSKLLIFLTAKNCFKEKKISKGENILEIIKETYFSIVSEFLINLKNKQMKLDREYKILSEFNSKMPNLLSKGSFDEEENKLILVKEETLNLKKQNFLFIEKPGNSGWKPVWNILVKLFEGRIENLIEAKKYYSYVYVEPKLDESRTHKMVFNRILTINQFKILVRNVVKYIHRTHNIRKTKVSIPIDTRSFYYNMLKLIEATLKDRNIQKLIIKEILDPTINRLFESVLVYFGQTFMGELRSTLDSEDEEQTCIASSPNYQAKVHSWKIRSIYKMFIKNLAENNNLEGKLLIYNMETRTSFIETMILNLINQKKSNRSNIEKITIERWMFELLEEFCNGPCLTNQKYVTQKEFLPIFNLNFQKTDLPSNPDHPKYQLDLAIIDFFLAVLEGQNSLMVKKIQMQILPSNLYNYLVEILKMLYLQTIQKNGDCGEHLEKFKLDQIHPQKPKSKNKKIEINDFSAEDQFSKIDRNIGVTSLPLINFEKDNYQELNLSVENKIYNYQSLNDMKLSAEKFVKQISKIQYGANQLYDLAVSSYLLLHTLDNQQMYTFCTTEISNSMDDIDWKLFKAFEGNMQVIELSNMRNLSEMVVFPQTPLGKEITEKMKNKMEEEIDLDNPQRFFYEIIDDMEVYKNRLKKAVKLRNIFGPIYHITKEKALRLVKAITFSISFIICLIIMSFGDSQNHNHELKQPFGTIVKILAIFNIVTCIFIIIIIGIIKIPLFIADKTKISKTGNFKKTKKKGVLKLIFWEILHIALQLCFSSLGLFASPLFYAWSLVLFVDLFKPTRFIMKALYQNLSMLIFTLIFMVIIILASSFSVATNFSDQFDGDGVAEYKVCDSFFRCFIYTLNLGKCNLKKV